MNPQRQLNRIAHEWKLKYFLTLVEMEVGAVLVTRKYECSRPMSRITSKAKA